MKKLLVLAVMAVCLVSGSAKADDQIAQFEKHIWFNMYNSSSYGITVHNFINQSAQTCYQYGGDYIDHDQNMVYSSWGMALYRHVVKCMRRVAAPSNKGGYYGGDDESGGSDSSYGSDY